MEFSLIPTEAPAWFDRLVFRRDGDAVVIEAVRESGTLLFECRTSAVKFSQLADLLLTE